MKLHQLRYFVAVVDTGSFSRAATRCGVTQPSLSQQIIKLEKELELSLFDRLGRSIAVTEAGHLFYPRAKRILADVDEARDMLAEELTEGHGHLSVGAIPTAAPYLLPCALAGFRTQWPDAELSITEDMTENLIRQLVDAEIDMAVMAAPLDDERIQMEPIAEERLVCVAPADHPLAQRDSVGRDELNDHPLIVLHEVHCLSQQVRAFCLSHRVTPRINCRAGQLSTLIHLVGLGLGISLIPQSAYTQQGTHLGVVPLEGPPVTRTLVAAWNASRQRPRLGSSLVDQVAEIARTSSDFLPVSSP